MSDEKIIFAVKHWLSTMVIGLNLCPFAKAPFNKGQVKFVVSRAETDDDLLEELSNQLNELAEAKLSITETTIVIVPNHLQEFEDYNQFLDLADDVVQANELEGVLQVASFHPQYQFAGTSSDDPENFSNRSPFPLLHLLREDSVSHALESEQGSDDIVARNIVTLNEIGAERLLLMNAIAQE